MSDPETFVSSIKIKGIQLLPPVITSQRRAELERDRQQAIKLGKRLDQCRALKKNLEILLNIPRVLERPQSAITFGDSSHIEDLGIKSARCSVEPKTIKTLSKDILDVTEYSNDGIKVITKGISTFTEGQQLDSDGSQAYETDTSSNRTDGDKASENGVLNLPYQCSSSKERLSEICPTGDSNKFSETEGYTHTPPSEKTAICRLIRSNSYTLEAPSPILLAHLEKCSKTDIPEPETETPSLSRTWTSLENNYVPFENSEFSSLNTVYHNRTPEELEPEKDTNKSQTPSIEVIQTDISVQQITVNANTDHPEPIRTTLDLTDPDCQLMQVLKKIPEDYSKQIIDLIERQRSEHAVKVENFGKQFVNVNSTCSTPVRENQDETSSVRPVSESPSQSVAYSFCSSDTLMPVSPSLRVIDLETCDEEGSVIGLRQVEGIPVDDAKSDGIPADIRKRTFSSNYRNLDGIKREWAACVIGAHVKGYLTRRLLRTERVQSLIETIRDALVCALQLHTIENIDEADIELHRRLINQVSAACYAFHDIFFALPIPDKMALISADRKRRIEKSRRPKSASDLRRSMSNSSRSSTKSVSSMTRSLTKI